MKFVNKTDQSTKFIVSVDTMVNVNKINRYFTNEKIKGVEVGSESVLLTLLAKKELLGNITIKFNSKIEPNFIQIVR